MDAQKFNKYFSKVENYLPENVREDVRKLTELLVNSRKWKGEYAQDVVEGCSIAAISAILGRHQATVIAKNLRNNGLFRVLRKIGDLALPLAYVDLAIDRLAVEKPEVEKLRDLAKDLILRDKNAMAKGMFPTPLIMAACAIYAAAKKCKVKITQRDISDVLGICDVSIRNHYRKFKEFHEEGRSNN